MTNQSTIKSIKKVQSEDVYDISVIDYENYILENGIITHNSGSKYSSSSILTISKSKEKEGTEVAGVILKFKTQKSRFSKENQEVEVRLYYDERGLDKYYGLIELGEESGIIPRIGNRYEIDGKKLARKQIMQEPEKYFTQELLERLDAYARTKFQYGKSAHIIEEEESEDDPAE